MITVAVKGVPELEKAFKNMEGTLRSELRKELTDTGKVVAQWMTTNLLSGQMLRVRSDPDARIRFHMMSKLFERNSSVQVRVYPKPSSPLWMLGSGMKARQIAVRKGLTRTQRRMLRWAETEFRKRKKVRLASGGTYTRMHHLNRVPFADVAFVQWRELVRGRLEDVIRKAASNGPG